MELLETFKVQYEHETRTIELYHGDLTDLRPDEAVDILVVSAFRGDYRESHRSLIRALGRKGVSVAELADDKAVDLRESCSCWLSKEISDRQPGMGFKRILCFEPENPLKAPELVGDIFRSLVPFIPPGAANTSVAMPLIGTGHMRAHADEILEAILDAASHWMALGLPLTTLKIVASSSERGAELRGVFERWRQTHEAPDLKPARNHAYDLFISYSQKNSRYADLLLAELRERRPDLRIFQDRLELNPGAAWQQQIYDALDSCGHVVALYSEEYVDSPMCKEEFNIARFRERSARRNLLFPILLFSTELPSYMAVIQYEDCREGDEQRLRKACDKLLQRLSA